VCNRYHRCACGHGQSGSTGFIAALVAHGYTRTFREKHHPCAFFHALARHGFYLLERFNATLVLAGTSFVLCSILGILAGVVSAARQYGFADKAITFTVLIGISVPSFFLGMMMILLFAVNLKWLPVSGMYAIYGGGDLPDLIRHLIMPALALSAVATGVIARLSRSAMLEVLRQDFIRTARAKGVRERKVIMGHALRAAMVSIIPVLGIQAGFVLSGAVYIEIVFQWPGVGSLFVNSVAVVDVPVMAAYLVFVALVFVVINLIVDILYFIVDPRLRVERGGH